MNDIGPGDIVICVDAANLNGMPQLIKGGTYRVRQVFIGFNGSERSPSPGIYLEGIIGCRCNGVDECGYSLSRFRPLDGEAAGKGDSHDKGGGVMAADLRPYWNDPAGKQAALDLIAAASGGVGNMLAAGFGPDAVLDVLCGTMAVLIEREFPADEDEETADTIAWAVKGKLRDARAQLPAVRAHLDAWGEA